MALLNAASAWVSRSPISRRATQSSFTHIVFENISNGCDLAGRIVEDGKIVWDGRNDGFCILASLCEYRHSVRRDRQQNLPVVGRERI